MPTSRVENTAQHIANNTQNPEMKCLNPATKPGREKGGIKLVLSKSIEADNCGFESQWWISFLLFQEPLFLFFSNLVQRSHWECES